MSGVLCLFVTFCYYSYTNRSRGKQLRYNSKRDISVYSQYNKFRFAQCPIVAETMWMLTVDGLHGINETIIFARGVRVQTCCATQIEYVQDLRGVCKRENKTATAAAAAACTKYDHINFNFLFSNCYLLQEPSARAIQQNEFTKKEKQKNEEKKLNAKPVWRSRGQKWTCDS